MAKNVVVTGGNSGIGLALCKLLATKHACYVFLGSRNAAKGKAALASIVEACPDAAGKIEVLPIDVSDDASCKAAAEILKAKNVTLYALVNNAGVGLAHGDVGGVQSLLNTNYKGPQRVTGALVAADLIGKGGRIVNVSSGGASMWLRKQDEATKTLFSKPPSLQALDAAVELAVKEERFVMGGGYGLSKAALTAYTSLQAKMYPHLTTVSLSPGFIDTNMTKGYGAKLSPEQGCVSSIHCLFEDVTSGWYYGSDAKRSPLTCTRDPGTPEYSGEDNPDPKKYNK